MPFVEPREHEHDGTPAASSRVATPHAFAAAKLLTALRTRPGHVLVIGETARAAEALFATVEDQVVTHRRLRVAGPHLDAEAALHALWADRVSLGSTPPTLGMVRRLANEARLAGFPIVVVVTEADAADPRELERLRQTLECVADASEVMHLVLLGGPGLVELLRRPEVRALARRVVAIVRVPAAEVERGLVHVVSSLGMSAPRPARARVATTVALGCVAALAAWMAWRPSPPGVAGTMHEAPEVPVVTTQAEVPPEADLDAPTAPSPTPPVRDETIPDPAAPVAPAPPEAPPAALAPAPPVATEPAPQPPHGLMLQVGAFRRVENAEALRARLAERFADVYVSPVERDGATYHRVRVGGFASEQDRQYAAAALRATGYAPEPARD